MRRVSFSITRPKEFRAAAAGLPRERKFRMRARSVFQPLSARDESQVLGQTSEKSRELPDERHVLCIRNCARFSTVLHLSPVHPGENEEMRSNSCGNNGPLSPVHSVVRQITGGFKLTGSSPFSFFVIF